MLEAELPQAVNENMKLKVKQTEDSKLWTELDSKVSSTKTLCDQLTGNLQPLASQAERDSLIKQLEVSVEKISAPNENLLEQLSSELQGRVRKLLEDSSLADNQKVLNTLKLESDNQELLCRVQLVLDEKSADTESLQHEIAKHDLQADTFGKQISELRSFLDEKEQLYISSIEREKSLEEQKLQVQASLAATECQLSEAKNQHDLMLIGKQIELSKYLKELSIRNDQAINDICKKYELEKVEIISVEKEKAEKLIREMENKCNEKIFENKRESERCLTRLKEEHGTVVARIQQDNEHKESTLRAYHKEELQRIRSQAENELKERLSSLRQQYQAKINTVNAQHEEDCQKLQDELELQKSKEKQRALLQLQWKVMGENEQVDQERRDSCVRKESKVQLAGPETKWKDVKLPGVIQPPVSNALRKVEKGTQDVPNHRKVTHHVETAKGKIAERRKTTKSTVMFGEPNIQKSFHNTADKDVPRTRKEFRFIGCILFIVALLFLPSAEARELTQISDPLFCNNHKLLSDRIDVACMPMQPQPMCCELLVPALDFHGCLCKLMKDGTKIDNFITKYISCGGQHPDFVEETKNCSYFLPNKPAPTPEVAEVAIIPNKSKNTFSVRWLLVVLIIVIIVGLLYFGACWLKRKLDASRVAPQTSEAELAARVAVHTRQTADVQIRNQHIEIPIVDDVPFLGAMTRGRFNSLKD